MKMLKKQQVLYLHQQWLFHWQPAEVVMTKVHQQILIHLRLVESDLQQEIMQFTEQR